MASLTKKRCSYNRQIRLERHSPFYWRVTSNHPPGWQDVPQPDYVITTLENDALVKIVVLDNAADGFFLTHYKLLVKPEARPARRKIIKRSLRWGLAAAEVATSSDKVAAARSVARPATADLRGLRVHGWVDWLRRVGASWFYWPALWHWRCAAWCWRSTEARPRS